MLENYIEQVDEDLNIHLPKDIVKKLKIKSNGYVKVRIKIKKTIELVLIKENTLRNPLKAVYSCRNDFFISFDRNLY